jgi:dUTPase
MARELKVKLLDNRARLPTKGSSLAAGLDLYAAEDVVIPKGRSATVSTEIAICVPPCTYGRVASRSGLAFKFDVDVAAGVIDRVSCLHIFATAVLTCLEYRECAPMRKLPLVRRLILTAIHFRDFL